MDHEPRLRAEREHRARVFRFDRALRHPRSRGHLAAGRAEAPAGPVRRRGSPHHALRSRVRPGRVGALRASSCLITDCVAAATAGIRRPRRGFLLIDVANRFKSAGDAELISRLRAGDEGAVADLVRAYGARVYQMAFRYLKNAEDAEELSQDVLFKAVDKIGEFRGDSALSSWLYRITFNAAMSRLRQLRGVRAAEVFADAASSDSGVESWTADVPDRQALADEEILRAQLRER